MPTPKKTKRKKVTKKKSPKNDSPKPKSLGTCFVMMPFRDPFGLYYQSIFKPAIINSNLVPIRADDLFRPSVIVSDLWQMIQDAKLLLAELTTKNANVFYELGLAHAIGKPVILVSETMDDVPFDLQQLRVLLYNKNDPAWGEKLSGDITKAIDETLASPVEAVPSIFRKTVPSQAPEQDAISARLDELESLVRRINTQVAQPSKGEDHVPHRLAQTILKLVEATGLEDQVVIHIGFNHPEAASFSPGETGVYCIFRNDTCIFIGGGDIRKGLLMAMNMASITVKSPNNIYIVKTAHAEFLKQHLVSFFDPVVTP